MLAYFCGDKMIMKEFIKLRGELVQNVLAISIRTHSTNFMLGPPVVLQVPSLTKDYITPFQSRAKTPHKYYYTFISFATALVI